MNNIINLLQKYYKLSGEQNESTKDLHFFIQKYHKILALLLLFPVFSSHTTRCKLPKKCEKTPFFTHHLNHFTKKTCESWENGLLLPKQGKGISIVLYLWRGKPNSNPRVPFSAKLIQFFHSLFGLDFVCENRSRHFFASFQRDDKLFVSPSIIIPSSDYPPPIL